MHHLLLLQLVFSLLLSPALSLGNSAKPPGKDAILLSRVHALTLRDNRLTSSRRVPPIPQLKCTGPSKRICDMYPIETMRCTNEGYDYDEEDVQWTCTTSLPAEFKLGATDVVCEGYRNADDKWVLKGSCGVEYRLLLTDLGEKRFGSSSDSFWPQNASRAGWSGVFGAIGNLIFFGFMGACFVMILWPMLRDCFGLRGNRRGQNGGGGGWGGFGGGGGGGGPYPGPPPPYTRSPDPRFSGSDMGWRPGFWSGALGGAAAGYGLGRRSNRSGSPIAGRRPSSFRRWDDPGEGSSGSRSPRFSSPSTSTGFGSTRRR
ncbi:hypothetical protein BO70DRAFT_361908 [Aspergillus heteromorphus CBS 117.55]|uniref:Store-operated calcium entry-associated regulatory factor n=1 Tax=Aspergillus heteromorphus CBS 117.55 TaxID=1448321 RepID=A0A317WFF6_9EURO|nr:uncharacterized protein BO70DRAFT_361908 [Aspergillus heteromorphus CBS 117.55]PWY82980.1 hypothetical protein BO70DRAFT_361908 [Aspergillus heteromorphus CBS 117.55]